MTKQKKTILEILKNTKTHPTADWIYQEARKVLPDISLGTVYRNLRVLKEQNEILELKYGSAFSRYDGNCENHYHFVCKDCGRVIDVDMDVLYELDEKIEKTKGVIVYYHRLEFYGTCSSCTTKED